MPVYHVKWEIDLEADSARESAEKARAIQQNRDPESIAHVYEVRMYLKGEPRKRTGAVKIDLDEIEGRV